MNLKLWRYTSISKARKKTATHSSGLSVRGLHRTGGQWRREFSPEVCKHTQTDHCVFVQQVLMLHTYSQKCNHIRTRHQYAIYCGREHRLVCVRVLSNNHGSKWLLFIRLYIIRHAAEVKPFSVFCMFLPFVPSLFSYFFNLLLIFIISGRKSCKCVHLI